MGGLLGTWKIYLLNISMLWLWPCYCHVIVTATAMRPHAGFGGFLGQMTLFFLCRQFQDNIRLQGFLRITATGLLHHLVPLPHTALCVLVLTTNPRLIKCLPRGFQRTTPRRQLETSYRSDSNIKPEVWHTTSVTTELLDQQLKW